MIGSHPELLFRLTPPTSAYARLARPAIGARGRGVPWGLDFLSRTPSAWQPMIRGALRFAYTSRELIDYGLELVASQSWKKAPRSVRALLCDLPDFLPELILGGTEATLGIAEREFSPGEMARAALGLIRDGALDPRELAAALVDLHGPSGKIPVLATASGKVGARLVAAVSEARWREKRSREVLDRIRKDWAKMPTAAIAAAIDNRELLDALKESP